MDKTTKVLIIALVVIVILYAVVLAARAEGELDDEVDSDNVQSSPSSGDAASVTQDDLIGLSAVIVACTGLGVGFASGSRLLSVLWS